MPKRKKAMARYWHSFKSFYRLLPLLPVSPVKGQSKNPETLARHSFYSFYRPGKRAFTGFELLPLLPAFFLKPVKGQKAIKINILQEYFELLPDSFYRKAGKSSQVVDFQSKVTFTENYPLKGVKKGGKSPLFFPHGFRVTPQAVKEKKSDLSFPAKVVFL